MEELIKVEDVTLNDEQMDAVSGGCGRSSKHWDCPFDGCDEWGYQGI